MMSKKTKRGTAGALRVRQDYMRRTLRRLALEFDADARFTVLAPQIGVQVTTVMRWIEKGRMPMTTADGLQSRFGSDLCNAIELSANDHV